MSLIFTVLNFSWVWDYCRKAIRIYPRRLRMDKEYRAKQSTTKGLARLGAPTFMSAWVYLLNR